MKLQQKLLSNKKLLKSKRRELEKNLVLIAENIGHIKGGQENVRLLVGSVRDVGEETILQSIAKASQKLKPRGFSARRQAEI